MTQINENLAVLNVRSKIDEAHRAITAGNHAAYNSLAADVKKLTDDMDLNTVSAAEFGSLMTEFGSMQGRAKMAFKKSTHQVTRVLKTVGRIALLGTGGAAAAAVGLYAYDRLFGNAAPIVEVTTEA